MLKVIDYITIFVPVNSVRKQLVFWVFVYLGRENDSGGTMNNKIRLFSHKLHKFTQILREEARNWKLEVRFKSKKMVHHRAHRGDTEEKGSVAAAAKNTAYSGKEQKIEKRTQRRARDF